MNQNKENDFVDFMDNMRKSDEFSQVMNADKSKETMKQQQHNDKMNLQREKLQVAREKAQTDLAIAKENKNKFDVAKKAKEKNKK